MDTSSNNDRTIINQRAFRDISNSIIHCSKCLFYETWFARLKLRLIFASNQTFVEVLIDIRIHCEIENF